MQLISSFTQAVDGVFVAGARLFITFVVLEDVILAGAQDGLGQLFQFLPLFEQFFDQLVGDHKPVGAISLSRWVFYQRTDFVNRVHSSSCR